MYWPTELDEMKVGDLTITLADETDSNGYIKRVLNISDEKVRQVCISIRHLVAKT